MQPYLQLHYMTCSIMLIMIPNLLIKLLSKQLSMLLKLNQLTLKNLLSSMIKKQRKLHLSKDQMLLKLQATLSIKFNYLSRMSLPNSIITTTEFFCIHMMVSVPIFSTTMQLIIYIRTMKLERKLRSTVIS